MTAKNQPQPTPKKPRRTAQEQALAPLIKRRDRLLKRREEALLKVEARFSDELGQLARLIVKIHGPAPEGE